VRPPDRATGRGRAIWLRWGMSEIRLLFLVHRYQRPAALVRHVGCDSVFESLHGLEARGLVRRQRGQYRLTRRGRSELRVAWSFGRLLAGVSRP
jgi:hypothetical protein